MLNKMNVRILTVCLTLLTIASFAAEARNFLWRVSSGEKQIHILGSIHAVKPDVYPLNENITKAFDASDVLAVEADTTAMDMAYQQKIAMRGVYIGNESLKGHVSADTYAKVMKRFKSFGMPEAAVSKMKPWMIVMLFAQFDLAKVGAMPQHGIDLFFINRAKKASKQIKELEGLDFQLKLFESLSEKMPDALLHFSMIDSENVVKNFKLMCAAWKNGDAEALHKFFAKMENDKMAKEITDVLLHKRNDSMTKTVKKYIASGKKYFVVVGAGHLVGKTGIIAQLRKQGFKVEQVKK